MGRPAATGLKPKHWKAIELFEEGLMSIKDIADACKIPRETMYDLFEGNTKAGHIASLFQEQLNKVTARNATKIRHLVKDTKKLALLKMNEYLRSVQEFNADSEMMRDVLKVMNTLSKSTPQVEVGSFSITKGMTPEELRHEFARLSALARFATVSRGVRSLKPRKPGELPPSVDGGNRIPKE